jgi:transposase
MGGNLERDTLEALLARGLSLEAIGERFGKHPSTVSYWMKKYGLEAANRGRHLAREPLDRDRLAALAGAGLSIEQIADAVGRSKTTVRYWLLKYELETPATTRRRMARLAHDRGEQVTTLQCRRHGLTEFGIEARGNYRCVRCRSEAVARRRRKVKEILVAEAGGACGICGYRRFIGALEFHHRDPAEKSFALSHLGLARSLERARAEARKCVLLCSNCHAEVENGMTSLAVE